MPLVDQGEACYYFPKYLGDKAIYLYSINGGNMQLITLFIRKCQTLATCCIVIALNWSCTLHWHYSIFCCWQTLKTNCFMLCCRNIYGGLRQECEYVPELAGPCSPAVFKSKCLQQRDTFTPPIMKFTLTVNALVNRSILKHMDMRIWHCEKSHALVITSQNKLTLVPK